MEERVRCVLFGQVDNGKSSLAGGLAVNSEMYSSHALENLKEKGEGEWLAHITDENPEEREKGITQEFSVLELKYFPLREDEEKSINISLIDTPGHKIFISEFISAICSRRIDVGMCVVSSKENEFEAGVSGGHIFDEIFAVRAMGIKNLIFAISKVDLPSFSMDGYLKIKERLLEMIKMLNFKQIEFVPISSRENLGIDSPFIFERIEVEGRGLVEVLSQFSSPQSVDTEDEIPSVQRKTIKNSKFQIKVRFLGDLNSSGRENPIIGPGKIFTMHCENHSIPIEIEHIFLKNEEKWKKLNYIQNKDFRKVYTLIVSPIECVQFELGDDKIILMNDVDFVGCGNLL